jgi:hypothetical protein
MAPLNPKQSLPKSLVFLNPIVVDDLARFGNPADGGYVLPMSRIAAVDALLSFGVSNNWMLEKDLAARRPGLLIHGYDHTISRRRFGQQVLLETAKMALLQSNLRQVVGKAKTYADYRKFFRGNRRHFRQRIFNRAANADDATIDSVFARIPDKSHVFLKMDIEGAEYRVIPDILRYSDRIDMMAIEFHDTDPLRDIFLKQVGQILIDFEIVHLHGNNYGTVADDGLPDFLEMSLVHRRFVDPASRRRDRLPLAGLDAPNAGDKPDLSMTFAS